MFPSIVYLFHQILKSIPRKANFADKNKRIFELSNFDTYTYEVVERVDNIDTENQKI